VSFSSLSSLTIRDYLIDGLLKTERRYREQSVKRLGYLSMEFLMGPLAQ